MGIQEKQRGHRSYRKPALTHAELLERLIDRGLQVDDQRRALTWIRHFGYYRLSPYLIPFRATGTAHRFRSGATMDEVMDLYVFDRKLRLLALDALERIEVALRAAVTDTLALKHGPHWHTHSSLFRDPSAFHRLQDDLRRKNTSALARHRRTPADRLMHPTALEHYLTTYAEPELPPSWVALEDMTFGSVAHLYTNLADSPGRREIAEALGVNAPLLTSWVRSYVRVRNIAAHHGRLWNVGLGAYAKLPTSPAVLWPRAEGSVAGDPKRLYPVLASLQSILWHISPTSMWRVRLGDHLRMSPGVPLGPMGFPRDWDTDPFWAATGPHRPG